MLHILSRGYKETLQAPCMCFGLAPLNYGFVIQWLYFDTARFHVAR